MQPSEYRDRLRAHLGPVLTRPSETVPLRSAAGRVLVTALDAPRDLPLFVNSQMDGYAVRAADVTGAGSDAPLELPVARVVAAGDPAGPSLEPGTAVKVMTGAALPAGADCVVPVEDTVDAAGAAGATDTAGPGGTAATIGGADGMVGAVRILAPRAAGEFVRRPGDDVRAGDRVVDPGTVLRARHLAAAASMGIPALVVRSRVRVAVLATGSELVPPGASPGPGQLWESNSVALAAACAESGCEVVAAELVPDDAPALRRALDDAVTGGAELVVTAGAVSMGDFEVVRQTLAPLPGAWFGHVAMQPGGPQGHARWAGVPVVCFPGNPVSALVSWEILLRPLLGAATGLTAPEPRWAPLARAVRSPAGKTQYLRGRMLADGRVEPVSGPGSHLVASMARADVLVEVPAEVTQLDPTPSLCVQLYTL